MINSFPSLKIACIICIGFTSCNSRLYHDELTNAKGFVIAKETCNTNETNDYWLIDFTYVQNTPRYGDTVLVNGVVYTNVVKTKGLNNQLKNVGMAVSIDFNLISPSGVATNNCDKSNTVTYNLKELSIIHQGEIR